MAYDNTSIKLWNTRNDVPREVRCEAIALLNQQLADALDLRLQATQAHWRMSRGVDKLLWKVEAHAAAER